MAVKVKKLNSVPRLRDSMQAKVKVAGNVVEVLLSTSSNPASAEGCPCVKISADEYMDTRTGETKQYEHIENRSECTRSFYRTLNRIRDLINANVRDAERCRFVTFTYRENMQDRERLFRDWKAFWLRFRRWCEKSGYKVPEYIAVVEPQGRGAWHLHVVLIWPGKAPFIDNNSVMETLWPHGFTKTEAVRGSIDNIGAYFGAYLTDVPLEEFEGDTSEETILEKEFTDGKGKKVKKKFVKGARARLYPAGMNIVRHSRGLEEPTIEYMDWSRVKEKVSGATETYKTAFSVQYTTGEELTQYVRIYYNTANQKKQADSDNTHTKAALDDEKKVLREMAEEILRKPPRIRETQQAKRDPNRLIRCRICGMLEREDVFWERKGDTGECYFCLEKRLTEA